MKKIIVIIALFCGLAATAQKTTPGNYTYIAQKYEWDAGIFKGLGLPSGAGPAAFITGQVPRAGAAYYDSVGVDSGFYVYSGLAWRKIDGDDGGTVPTLQQVFDTEVGGAVLTKEDSVLMGNHGLTFFNGRFGIGATANNLFTVGEAARNFLTIDPDNNRYEIGDINGLLNSTYMSLNDATGNIEFNANGAMTWGLDTLATRAYARSIGGGGLSEIIAGYGLQNVNDSTLDVDTTGETGIANKEWTRDRLDSLGSVKLDKDKVGAYFIVSNDSLKLKDIVNVVDYGADPTGVSNCVTAFASAISTGKTVFVPAGTFLFTGSANTILLALNTGQKIYGMGEASILKTTSQARILAGQPFCVIDNLTFQGNKSYFVSDQYQTGIVMSTNDTAWTISNCTFRNLGGSTNYTGGAIYLAAALSGETIGGRIINCGFYDNYIGLTIGERAEYTEVSNNKFSNNRMGAVIAAGNITVSLNNFQSNDTALKYRSGTNNGHGIVSSNNINHNNTNLVIRDVSAQGMSFIGNHFYAGDIIIANSEGIMFNGCDFVQGDITLTNNTKLFRQGGRVPVDPTNNHMPISLVSGETFLDINNFDF